MEQVALFGDRGCDNGRIGDRIFGADDLAETSDQFGRERGRGGLDDIHLGLWLVFLLVHSRAIAARRSRSLIASPSPSPGTGITAMVCAPLVSSVRRYPKRLAAASWRSPRADRFITAVAASTPGSATGPNASSASPGSTLAALSRTRVRGA